MHKTNLLLFNANVLTMDEKYPHADAVAIGGGKILGLSRDVKREAGQGKFETIDCRGRTVLPGFIDAHCHFIAMAEQLSLPHIGPEHAGSIADILQIIKNRANVTPPGAWIRAAGYHVYNLAEKRHPNRWELDKVTTQHPVCLSHVTGYIHVLNSLALSVARIGMSTEAPAGGVIERDLDTGEPSGVLLGMRSYLSEYLPQVDEAQMPGLVKLASDYTVSQGITSLQDASFLNDKSRWNKFAQYRRQGILKPRVTLLAGLNAFKEGQFNEEFEEVDGHLALGGVKVVVNEITGELNPSMEELRGTIDAINRRHKQAVLHAIEEHVVSITAEALGTALDAYPRADHRHRIEHCSVCTPQLARYLAKLHAVVVSQPNFIYYNGERYLKTVPQEQLPYLYPFNTLLGSGVMLAAGSDSPVTPANPLNGIYSAVTRLTQEGNDLVPAEKVAVMQALRMYTVNAAYAAFEERQKGSLVPGKYADLVVLNHDPGKVKLHEIKELQVQMVIIGGEIVYRKDF